MKKTLAAFLLTLVLLSARQVANVRADGLVMCSPGTGVVIFPNNVSFAITRAEKTGPPHPIVIGQDLEAQTGVEISIEIQSYPGTVKYGVYAEQCLDYTHQRDDLTACGPKDGRYHYLTRVCVPHTETVYRNINAGSLKVWLVPDQDTDTWLTGDLITGNGRNPLRYVYPEKWALGTWTPKGSSFVGDSGLWAGFQVEKFAKANPGFNFLSSDPQIMEVPSYALPRVLDPTGAIGSSDLVLGLYGEFGSKSGYGTQFGSGACLAHRPGTGGWCEPILGEHGGSGPVESHSTQDLRANIAGAPDLTSDDITYMALNLHRVPMDLPGTWYIAIEVSVNPATYYYDQRTEKYNVNSLTLCPGDDYILTEHAFSSHIWLSTPCNPDEPRACENLTSDMK